MKFVENLDGSRLIATSNYNFALTSPKVMAQNDWSAVSINGEKAMIMKANGERLYLSKPELGLEQIAFIERVRDEITDSNVAQQAGYTQVQSGSTGEYLMSSSQKSTSSSSFTSSASSGTSLQEMNFSAKDDNNFSVSKSDLPLGWSRVFFNQPDFITIVYKDGNVLMLKYGALNPEERIIAEQLRRDVAEMRRRQTAELESTMSNSLNMVSNIFSNVVGRFPKPPDYQTAVGGMFGDNFPFGTKNSPFSPEAGWPFGGRVGAPAAALAA